jgi:hypothetical protein
VSTRARGRCGRWVRGARALPPHPERKRQRCGRTFRCASATDGEFGRRHPAGSEIVGAAVGPNSRYPPRAFTGRPSIDESRPGSKIPRLMNTSPATSTAPPMTTDTASGSDGTASAGSVDSSVIWSPWTERRGPRVRVGLDHRLRSVWPEHAAGTTRVTHALPTQSTIHLVKGRTTSGPVTAASWSW